VPAKNIAVEIHLYDPITHQLLQKTNINIPESSKILPNKLYTFEITSDPGSEKNKKFIERAKKEIELNEFNVLIIVIVNYETDIDESTAFQTLASYKYNKDDIKLINLQQYE